MVKEGNKSVTKVYFGDKEVVKIQCGTAVLYEKENEQSDQNEE